MDVMKGHALRFSHDDEIERLERLDVVRNIAGWTPLALAADSNGTQQEWLAGKEDGGRMHAKRTETEV
jgi:hypothetical protein